VLVKSELAILFKFEKKAAREFRRQGGKSSLRV
jgi:hypothetical protein